MSTEQLKAEALALPVTERASLAQALWQSIGTSLPESDEGAAVREAIARDEAFSSNAVVGRTHDEVMQAARRAIKCS